LVGLLGYDQMPIALDRLELEQGREAWVPVRTLNGRRGVLVWNNCD
jgi:hypothetical protein